NYEYGEDIYHNAVLNGYMPEEVKVEMLGKILPLYKSLNRAEMTEIIKIESSLAAMKFMLVARSYGYDTKPIGGFEKDQIAEALDLVPESFEPVIIVAIRNAKHPGHDSYRLSAETVTKYV